MPLLRELSAVEQLLNKHLAASSHLPACVREPSPGHVELTARVEPTSNPADTQEVKQAQADDEEEQDFTCAICMVRKQPLVVDFTQRQPVAVQTIPCPSRYIFGRIRSRICKTWVFPE